jgi:hypothetical protein
MEQQMLEQLERLGIDVCLNTPVNTEAVRKFMIIELLKTLTLCSSKVKNCRPKKDRIQWVKAQSFVCQTATGILKAIDDQELENRLEDLENAIRQNDTIIPESDTQNGSYAVSKALD